MKVDKFNNVEGAGDTLNMRTIQRRINTGLHKSITLLYMNKFSELIV